MSTVNRSLHNNIKIIYLMGFFHSFMVVVPIFVPLLQGYGLSMSQVLQTQAIFALTVALCEVPSGYIADIFGRRRAVLIGSLFNGFGFFSLLWADSFVDFLVYEVVLGVGLSLISGADLAILYDTEIYLEKRGDRKQQGVNKSLSKLIAIEAGASGVAGIIASVLLLWSLDWVIWVQAIVGFMPLLLGLSLVEPPRPVTQGSHKENARQIIELLLFGKPVVLWTAFAIVVFGLLGIYSFWMYQKYWEMQAIPLANFGYIWAAFALTVSLAARYAGSLEQKFGSRRLLIGIAVLPIIGLLGMALGSGWFGVMFGFAIQITRGISLSLFYEALNKRVPGDFRATVNSLVSLGMRGIFIVTGPVLGYMLDSQGIGNTLIGLAVIFAPLIAVVLVPLVIRIGREDVEEEVGAAVAS
jgi:MFS family permease